MLIGTTLPPFNVLWAFGFWFGARVRYRSAPPGFSRCLNVQLTYTLLLGIPFAVSALIARVPALQLIFIPDSQPSLIAGLSLGLIGAVAVILLVFFNTRIVAEHILDREISEPLRLRWVSEREPAAADS